MVSIQGTGQEMEKLLFKFGEKISGIMERILFALSVQLPLKLNTRIQISWFASHHNQLSLRNLFLWPLAWIINKTQEILLTSGTIAPHKLLKSPLIEVQRLAAQRFYWKAVTLILSTQSQLQLIIIMTPSVILRLLSRRCLQQLSAQLLHIVLHLHLSFTRKQLLSWPWIIRNTQMMRTSSATTNHLSYLI
jgi:hypothetical protein